MTNFEIIAFACICLAACVWIISEVIASAPLADDDTAFGDTTGYGRDE